MTIPRRGFKMVPAAAAIGLLVFASAAFAQDTTDTPMQRAEELLRQMTIEEKAMQLSSVFPLALFDTDGADPQPARRPAEARHRACVRARPDRAQDARDAREVGQRHPALPGHGDAAQDPRDLPQRGDERRGGAPLHGTSPPRSGSRRRGTPQRWRRWPTSSGARCGRWACSRRWRPSWTWPAMPVGGGCSETYGEDPYLVSAMSVAYTRGTAGERPDARACWRPRSTSSATR